MSDKKHIVIIGAGAGGATTAARLSREGFQVTVVEKNDFVGGRCSLIEHNGFRFDQGPSLFILPEFYHDTFADLDERFEDHVELLKCSSNYKVYFEDGDTIHLTSDLGVMKKEIERVEGPEGFGRLLDFLQEGHLHYDKAVGVGIKQNFENIWDLFRLKYLPNIFRLHLFDSVYDRASKYFKTKKMRMALTFNTLYMGLSPYDAPGVYNLLQYSEMAEGMFYPKGGFNTIIQRIETIARDKYGAKFIYNAPVKKINTDDKNKQVTGITLENGQVIHADAVVCNADLVYAYHHLLPSCEWTKKRLATEKLTSSSISFYWSLSRKVPELDAHDIFLVDAYKENFVEIFDNLALPKDASFYVHVPSRVDPSAAPEGKEAIHALVPIGHMKNFYEHDEDYPKLVVKAKEMVLQVLERSLGIKDFASLIEHEEVNDPSIWQSKFNLWRGSILGLAHRPLQVLWFRPSTKDSTGRYDNLFFVGASTHPGTGLPLALAGSKLTSDQVCKNFKKKPLPRKIESTSSYKPEEEDETIGFSKFFLIPFVSLLFLGYFFPQYINTIIRFISQYQAIIK